MISRQNPTLYPPHKIVFSPESIVTAVGNTPTRYLTNPSSMILSHAENYYSVLMPTLNSIFYAEVFPQPAASRIPCNCRTIWKVITISYRNTLCSSVSPEDALDTHLLQAHLQLGELLADPENNSLHKNNHTLICRHNAPIPQTSFALPDTTPETTTYNSILTAATHIILKQYSIYLTQHVGKKISFITPWINLPNTQHTPIISGFLGHNKPQLFEFLWEEETRATLEFPYALGVDSQTLQFSPVQPPPLTLASFAEIYRQLYQQHNPA